jgi:uncharacterized protein (TIGR04255 family)
METIKSYAEKNAVKVVAFGFNFASKISNDDMDKCIKELLNVESFKSDFDSSLSDEISMTIGPDGIPHQKRQVGGIVFRGKSNGWEINFTSNFLIVSCKEYTRWNSISQQAYVYINILFDKLKYSLNHITLEYLDEFEILRPKQDWKNFLLNSECIYLNKKIFDTDDFWHINQGAFINIQEVKEKILDTININYFSDELDNFKNKINIRTQHIVFFNQITAFDKEEFETYFNLVHIHSKNIFEDIINKSITDTFKEE